MKIGKEIECMKFKKNKLETNIEGIIGVLQDKTLDKFGFVVDEGVTSEGLEFHTWRFYFKKKAIDTKPKIPNYKDAINRERPF